MKIGSLLPDYSFMSVFIIQLASPLQNALFSNYRTIPGGSDDKAKQFLPLKKVCIINDCSLDTLKYRKQTSGDVYQQSIALSSQTVSYCFDLLKSTNRLTMLRRSFIKRKNSKTKETKEDDGINIKTISNKAKFSNNTVLRRAGNFSFSS
ncbi:unnamed protein product [Onchocerca ochengi]|uniref:Uncharacterized protein n=1 Tax=Onchocerca ochengi TaxID=42157 RepID=A0A182EP85_ONCOC|nr:unnamed protein product [Onchocerca ochengi]